MPSQTREQAPTVTSTSTGVGTAAPETTQKYGNSAEQDRVAPGAGGDAGLASYESALGEFLGGELYKAVSRELGFDKFSKAAHSAVDDALKGLVKSAGGWDAIKSDPKALDALGKILGDLANPLVDKWLEADGKELSDKLAKWVGAHPRTVVTVALLAAVGAVLANMSLPKLKAKFNIGKHAKGEIEAEVGRIRSISLEKIKAKISDSSGSLLAAVEVAQKDGKTEGSAELKLGATDDRQILAKGTFDGDGLKVAGLKGVLQTDVGKLRAGTQMERGKDGSLSSLSLERKEGNLTLTDGFTYNSGTGVLTIGRDELRDLGEGLSVSKGTKTGSDGSREASMGMGVKRDGVEANAKVTAKEGAYGLNDEQKLQMGLKLDRDSLKLQLDAEVARANNQNQVKLKSQGERDLGDGHRAGGSLKLETDKNLLEVGAFYGFKDPNSFRSWLVEYKYNSNMDDNQFKGMLQDKLGDVHMRYQGAMQWGGNGRAVDLSVHGAHFFNKDTAAIAGMNYRRDLDRDTNSFKPEVGIQHKGVQVLFGYDTAEKAGTIRLGIPF